MSPHVVRVSGRVPAWRLRRWLPAVLAAGLAGPLLAQQPPPADPPAPVAPMPVKPAEPAKPVEPPQKTVSFVFEDKPWAAVLEWFGKESGLTFVSDIKPTGTVTIKPPDPTRKYTIPEVVDLLNEALSATPKNKFVIVRRSQTFAIYPADEKIPIDQIPQITIDELPRKGNTEMVTVVVPLKTLLADEMVPQIKTLKGPFGDVNPFGANQVIIQDTAGNIRRITEYVKKLEDEKDSGGDTLTHVCKFIRAADAADTLKTLLSDSTTQVTQANPATFPGQQPFGFPQQTFTPPPDPRGRGATSTGIGQRFRTVNISVQERSNTVILTGPPDKISAAENLLKKIDVGKPGQPELQVGPPEIRFHPVAAGTAPAIATTLQKQYSTSSLVAISAVPGKNEVMVYAPPGVQVDVALQLRTGVTAAPTTQAEVLPLSGLKEPKDVKAALQRIFPDVSGGAILEERTDPTPAIIVRGTAGQIAEIKEALKLVDPTSSTDGSAPGGPASRLRVLTVENGSAAVLAEEIARIMRRTRPNPVEVNDPSRPEPKPAPAPMPKPGDRSSMLPPAGPRLVTAQLVDPQKPQEPPADPKAKPVVITVSGNRILITSDDPEALDYAQQLARFYMVEATKVNESLFEVIRLKNASAEEAAKVISETFNGPTQQGGGAAPGGGRGGSGGGGGLGGALGFFTQFAGLGAQAPANPSANRVRVVAEKQSNSLIVVKASPLDLATMKLLLQNAIDNGETEPSVALKTRIIGLKYAAATDIAATLKDVYANLTTRQGGGGGGQSRGGGFPFPFPIGGQQQGGGAAQPAQLSIGVDDRTNSLIVNCNDAVYQELVVLTGVLDDAAKDQNDVIQVVKLDGIDPTIVEQAILALTGTPQQTRQQGTSTGTQGGFGGSRGVGGGFPSGFGGSGFPGGTRGGMGTGGGSRGTGGTRGGTRRSDDGPPGSERRAPENFSYRDTDVPSAPSPFYDPEANRSSSAGTPDPEVMPASFAQQPGDQEQPPPAPMPGGQPPRPQPPPTGRQVNPNQGVETFTAPSGEVRADALPELGLLVLKTRTPQDMAELLKLIEYIKSTSKTAQIKLELVPLQHQDATSIVNLLNTIYSRVQLGAGSSAIVPGGTQQRAGGFGGGGLFGGGQQLQGSTAQAQTVGSLFLLPLPRFNSILLAVPESRRMEVLDQIKQLDVPNGPQAQPGRFPLKKASAQVVTQQLQQFFSQRYPGETLAANQIRVTFDASTNTVLVQASPADLKDVADLIKLLDEGESQSKNELRHFRLNYAAADQLAQIINAAISSSVLTTTAGTAQANLLGQAGGLGGAGGALGGANQLGGGGGLNQFATGAAGAVGAAGRLGGAGGALGTLAGGASGALSSPTTKTTTLRFYSSKDGKVVESGFLEDVHIVPNVQTNGLVVAAPEKTMRLIEKLIEDLDVPSAARSDVKVFTLKKADAQATATLITQLFSTSGTPGGGQQLGGQLGGLLGAQGGAAAQQRPLITVTDQVSPGATLLGLRITTDTRTNTLIAAGSPSDLDTIRAIIARLEDAEQPQLRSAVYRLRHASSADVQTAVQTFMTNKLSLDQQQFQTAFNIIQRTVFIQPEPVSNTLLIAAVPQYFDEVIRLIEKVDAPPPQVYVQVVIAEVLLQKTQEFGVEVGIQSPVLFARSSTFASPGTPGFNFNTTAPLPNTTLVDPGIVGFQGLGNLGVGRSGSVGVGGFVFSAASDTFSLLIRALTSQNRLDVISRPQLLLLDNQSGFFQVGQQFPLVTGSTASPNVGITQDITYVNTGVTLRVTPKINPDGKVLMRLEPQIINPSPTLIPLGNGNLATALDTQAVETTVLAADGETLVIGGLIRKSDQKTENKIPGLGDLPWVGAAFRYRTQQQSRREIVFIVTPHLVRGDDDLRRVSGEEARKMNWCFRDVAEIHTHGMDVLNGVNPQQPLAGYPYCPPAYQPPPMVQTFPGPIPLPAPAPLPGGLVPDGYPLQVAPELVPVPDPGMFPPGMPVPQPIGPQVLPGGVVPDGGANRPMPAMPVQPTSGYARMVPTPPVAAAGGFPIVPPVAPPSQAPELPLVSGSQPQQPQLQPQPQAMTGTLMQANGNWVFAPQSGGPGSRQPEPAIPPRPQPSKPVPLIKLPKEKPWDVFKDKR